MWKTMVIRLTTMDFFRTKNHDNHIGEETLLSATALKDEN